MLRRQIETNFTASSPSSYIPQSEKRRCKAADADNSGFQRQLQLKQTSLTETTHQLEVQRSSYEIKLITLQDQHSQEVSELLEAHGRYLEGAEEKERRQNAELLRKSDELCAIEDRVQELEFQLSAAEVDVSKRLEELQVRDERITELSGLLAEAEINGKELERRENARAGETTAAVTALRASEEQLDSLRGMIGDYETEMQENEKKVRRCGELEASVAEMRHRVAVAERERDANASERDDAAHGVQQAAEAHRAREAELRQEVADAKAEVAELRSEHERDVDGVRKRGLQSREELVVEHKKKVEALVCDHGIVVENMKKKREEEMEEASRVFK